MLWPKVLSPQEASVPPVRSSQVARGVSLGLVTGGDHFGGRVRNNFVRWDPAAAYAVDVPLYTTSPGAPLLHNAALTSGRYPNAIEVRFPEATGVQVRSNLLDAAVQPRDGATPLTSGNLTSALSSWFVDPAAGDLHLTASATPALDQVTFGGRPSADHALGQMKNGEGPDRDRRQQRSLARATGVQGRMRPITRPADSKEPGLAWPQRMKGRPSAGAKGPRARTLALPTTEWWA